jgi:heme-degrading monooxygenase HmoA
MQVMTVVEGKVPASRVHEFETAYASIKGEQKPPGWKRSMLLRDTKEQGLYRISTLWETREALDAMRKSTSVPVAIALFRNVGVEPDVRIFEIPITIER